jgi:hypothetical protein
MNEHIYLSLRELAELPDDKGSGKSKVTLHTTYGAFDGYPEIVGDDDTVQIRNGKRETLLPIEDVRAVVWNFQD